MSTSRQRPWLAVGLLALALAAGCAPPPAAPPAVTGFALAPAADLRKLAEPTAHQWSTGLVNSPAIQRARLAHQATRATRAPRELQNVTTNWDSLSTAFPGASGKISSAPSYFYGTASCYWITESGWLLKYNQQTNTKSAWRVSLTDTFPNTSVTLSSDGARAYLVSAEGKLHVVSTADGTHATGSPVALGGTSPYVPFGTPVFIDSLASQGGVNETVYAVTAQGTLKRLISSRGAGGNSVTLVDSFALPLVAGEVVRSSPVVLRGKAVITTWRRSTAGVYDHADDKGAVIYYDTKVTTPGTGVTSGIAGQIGAPVVLEAPLWAPPAVETDDDLSPLLAFVPAGNGVAMVDLVGGRWARSVPLVVDSAATATGDLAGYSYTSASTVLPVKNIVANGAATITTGDGAGAGDTAQVFGAKQVSSTNAAQVYGYARFSVTDQDLTAGNVLKAVFGARLDLRNLVNSNHLAFYNPLPPRLFRVHNELSAAGTDWLSTNLSFAARPPHMDGTAFDQTAGALTARATWELSRTGTSVFVAGLDYTWDATGQIAQPGQDYTVGFVHTQLHSAPTLFGGLLSVPSPRFKGGAGADGPRLYLTASDAGMANPTLSAPVTIDSLDQQIYAVNTNALFKLSYANTTSNWTQGVANFVDDDQTRFALTSTGADAANAGPLHTGATRFVEPVTAPLFDGTYVYVHANHPGYTRSTITRFAIGAASAGPTQSGTALLLPANSGGLTPFMSHDYVSNRLFLATYDTGTSAGRAWMVNRF